MDSGDALDLFHTVGGVFVKVFAGTVPIFPGIIDFVLRDHAPGVPDVAEAIRCSPLLSPGRRPWKFMA
ncbi:hypothetical protein SAMN02927900_04536 [Rhizobium mongolense subsp. loessense]|uniref:Uncharacterized protein n=1 Tax=Rhizobium mongolense subsp. loessense TaxID=158890 RepID=A0A1G4T084_9HYPH|nr:hypothetical protein SAMN02927900_04536 [Rhizobium mongolense subsp. loessense]